MLLTNALLQVGHPCCCTLPAMSPQPACEWSWAQVIAAFVELQALCSRAGHKATGSTRVYSSPHSQRPFRAFPVRRLRPCLTKIKNQQASKTDCAAAGTHAANVCDDQVEQHRHGQAQIFRMPDLQSISQRSRSWMIWHLLAIDLCNWVLLGLSSSSTQLAGELC